MAEPESGTHSTGVGFVCPQCGYNLRGIASDLCPECAYSLAFLRQAEPQLPWLRRDKIGSVRAYWRTVWWVTFRRLKFGEELTRPMSLPDARRFHCVTMCHFYVAIVLLTAVLGIEGPRNLQRAFQNHTTSAVCAALVVHFCTLLFFAVACRFSGDSIRNKNMPVSRQAQIVGLSYYAAGVFAWLPLIWLLAFLSFGLAIAYARVWYLGSAFAIFGCVFSGFSAALCMLWMNDLGQIERCIVHRSAAEEAKVDFKQLLVLGFAGLVIIFMLPLAIAYVGLVVFSLV